MSALLEMMAADYERRAVEQRREAARFKVSGLKSHTRAAQANARKYESEARSLRETIARNAALSR